MSKRVIRVTDHALIRYLERVDGVDVDAARRVLQRAADLGAEHDGANAVVCNGIRFYINGCALTTVMPANRPNLQTGRQRKGHRDGPEDGGT